MAAKTLATYIGELSAGTSLGAGDKIPTLEAGAMVYFDGALVGGVTSDIQTQLNAKQASDADLTTIAGLTPADDDFLQRKSGAWANRTVAQVKTDLGVPTYARYVALLTQTGTDAPVATVLENTLGGTVVWTRSAAGDYIGTLAGAFTSGKTWFSSNCEFDVENIWVANLRRVSDDEVGLYTTPPGGTSEDGFTNVAIEIRVYP